MKLFKVLVSATILLSFVACQKIETVYEPLDGEFEYLFSISNADNSPETRATFGGDAESGVYVKWEDQDVFGAYATYSASGETYNSNNRPSTVSVNSSGYTLKVAVSTAMTSGANVYTYFPYYSGAGSASSAAIINIPQIQTQKASGFNASAMPMAGQPFQLEGDVAINSETEVGTIQFGNLGAIIKFRIYSSKENAELIKSVEFQADENTLAGDFTLNLQGVDVSTPSTLALQGGTLNSVKTTLETPVAIPTSKDNAAEIYMIVAPGSYTGNVVVTTDSHTYTFEISTAKTFNRSRVKPLAANLANATNVGEPPIEEEWNLVTSAADFTEGTYVIVSSDKASYLVNGATNVNPSSSSTHWDNNGKLINVTSDAKWIATASGTGLQFASFANNGNLLWMSTSKAQGVTVGSSSDIENAKKVWTVVANETLGGDGGLIATTGSNRYLALYTNGTWRGYTINANSGYLNNDSNIKAATFYKLVDNTPQFSVASPLEATAAEDTYTITVSRTNFTGAITVTVPESCNWIVAENVPENGTSFDILVSKNSGSSRSAILTLTGSGVESQSLVVNQAGNEAGSEANPYTVSAALGVINTLANNTKPDDEVYIQGTISSVSSYNGTYKSITYFISDDGSTTDQLEVYSGKGLNGADFSDITNLAVGDQVVIKGYLYKYYNENSETTTPEIYQSSQIVSINPVTRYTVTLDAVSNGTIAASATSVAEGASVKLTATPNSGYSFSAWSVTTSAGETVTVTDNKFTMPASNVTVSATFVQSNAKTVTYKQTYSASGNTVATTGTAPQGSSCSWTTTYTNSNQLTAGKSMTYTITGFDGKKITGLSLHMKTNASKGKGSVSMKHGDTEFGTYSVSVIGSTYETKDATVTATTIGQDETVTVQISATENSVYCDYITLTYE